VGHAYYGTFFAACDRLLSPGGRVVLQVITIPDQRYAGYRRNPDWIQKHIFPGGMLPSLTALARAMTRASTLTVEHLDNIGVHYAETLRRWRAACEAKTDDLAAMGYDAVFQRKWIYYLCYCEAGFQTRFTNDLHLVLARPGDDLL
jgi:cyclopropane-fatty-acyl-phospholipid synthase